MRRGGGGGGGEEEGEPPPPKLPNLNMYSDFNEHTQLDVKNDTKKRFVCVL